VTGAWGALQRNNGFLAIRRDERVLARAERERVGLGGSCVTRREPARSPLAVGVLWASRVTTLGLEFALPAMVGYYVDERWRTKPVATLVGCALGFAVGMTHILRFAREGTGS
jgi:ATP synthase protein I